MPGNNPQQSTAEVRLERAWANQCPDCEGVCNFQRLEEDGPVNFNETRHCSECEKEFVFQYGVVKVLEVAR